MDRLAEFLDQLVRAAQFRLQTDGGGALERLALAGRQQLGEIDQRLPEDLPLRIRIGDLCQLFHQLKSLPAVGFQTRTVGIRGIQFPDQRHYRCQQGLAVQILFQAGKENGLQIIQQLLVGKPLVARLKLLHLVGMLQGGVEDLAQGVRGYLAEQLLPFLEAVGTFQRPGVKALQQLIDRLVEQQVLLIFVEHRKIRIDAGGHGKFPQDTGAEGVDGGDLGGIQALSQVQKAGAGFGIIDRFQPAADHARHPLGHLCRRFFGEGNRQHVAHIHLLFQDELEIALDQNGGLAGAGPGGDGNVPVGAQGQLLLRGQMLPGRLHGT